MKLADAAETARQMVSLIAPELALTGYPPEDLLLRPALIDKLNASESRLCEISRGLTLMVGAPSELVRESSTWDLGNNSARPASLWNSLIVYKDGVRVTTYHKQSLPNYQVFDERRYFVAGSEPQICDRWDWIGLLFAKTFVLRLWKQLAAWRCVCCRMHHLLQKSGRAA